MPFISPLVSQPEADHAEGHRRDADESIARHPPTTRTRARARMCSASASRKPSAPKCRSTIQSLSARNRRPSWMPVSIRFFTPACPSRRLEIFRASARTPARTTSIRRQYSTLRSNGVNSHLCGLTTSESACSAPRRIHSYPGTIAATPAYAASTCSHTRSRRADVNDVGERIDARGRRRADRGDRRRAAAGPRDDRPRWRARARRAACGNRHRRECVAARRGRGRAGSPPCRRTSARARNSRREAPADRVGLRGRAPARR